MNTQATHIHTQAEDGTIILQAAESQTAKANTSGTQPKNADTKEWKPKSALHVEKANAGTDFNLETPLEKYIKKQFREREKTQSAWPELEKYGRKLPSGGHMWTGRDLIRYFEAQKKKRRRKRK